MNMDTVQRHEHRTPPKIVNVRYEVVTELNTHDSYGSGLSEFSISTRTGPEVVLRNQHAAQDPLRIVVLQKKIYSDAGAPSIDMEL